ncbi:prepilin-type N-terminal cleavage/methylation domain-containing protein [Geobacter sulfurreducens]|uniref:prepilin-type N-terminal cleavage/methylation domain-containing protein n=1 Tax=Geobacter sulfurreducens TaxID=35554 RepID=UPI000E655757|nr:prepilin-type N-terminal cleavage/methylation domain-containing protein [Geobacter sulfurreducens]
MRTAGPGDKGFTLIEVLVAMVIILVGLLGLLQAVNVSMEHNLRNSLRDEAVRVGESTVYGMRRLTFDNLTGETTLKVNRSLRASTKEYTVKRNLTDLGGRSTELVVTVEWDYRGTTYQHRVSTIISNPQ